MSSVVIGWSWKIKFGKSHYLFGKNMNSKCQNTPFIWTETKMDDSILFPVKISYNWSSISGVMIGRSLENWKLVLPQR